MAQGRGPNTGSINRRQSRFKATEGTVLHNRRRRHPAKAGLIESMSRPIVAIVGRPNVGKSTLFNRVLGWRKAIVDPQSGLTPDRLYGIAEWRGREFSIVDTAGMAPRAAPHPRGAPTAGARRRGGTSGRAPTPSPV